MGTNQMKRNLMTITRSVRKYTTKPRENTVKMQYIGSKFLERRIKGLQFWQTKSFAIITHAALPGDCIDRVISQNGDRVMLERLATPRPTPKGIVKSDCLAQQQHQQPQQLTLEEGVNSSWKQHATWESKVGVRDEPKNATEVDMASTKLVRTVSKVDVDVGTHLSEQQVIT